MSGATPIAFDQVTRRYGPVLGLNDVTLHVGPGITGLIGPNGAGKTTFLNLAVGLHRPSSGSVRVFGGDAFSDPAIREKVGYCPDGERVWEWMDGRTFVATLGTYSGVEQSEAQRRADALLDELEMTPAARKPISAYSRGMRQKVKVAQAVLHEPELLVLDEPLNGVDPLSRHQILKMLETRAKAGCAILVSSHVLHELGAFVDQVILLQRGRLLASGTVESIRELLDEHPHTVRFACTKPRKLGRELLSLGGVVSATLTDDGGLDVRTRNPAELYSALPRLVEELKLDISQMFSPDSDLEAVFKYLVKGGGG